MVERSTTKLVRYDKSGKCDRSDRNIRLIGGGGFKINPISSSKQANNVPHTIYIRVAKYVAKKSTLKGTDIGLFTVTAILPSWMIELGISDWENDGE